VVCDGPTVSCDATSVPVLGFAYRMSEIRFTIIIVVFLLRVYVGEVHAETRLWDDYNIKTP
jgi:uncharacterized membrane protein YkvI